MGSHPCPEQRTAKAERPWRLPRDALLPAAGSGSGKERGAVIEKLFHVSEKGSNIRTELLVGLTTFMTMAYILMVNSGMFAELPGVSYHAIYIATALSAAIGTILIGFLANLPLAQASAMGSNAFFVYTVCLGFGLSYANALALVLLDGIAMESPLA